MTLWKTVDYEVKLLFQNKSLMIISFKAAVIWRNKQINGWVEHYVGCTDTTSTVKQRNNAQNQGFNKTVKANETPTK